MRRLFFIVIMILSCLCGEMNLRAQEYEEEGNVESCIPQRFHPASFKGGDLNTFNLWVKERLVYPKWCDDGVQARVLVGFTIKKNGKMSDVKILKGVHPDLDNEALRVVKSSPKWTPGTTLEGEPMDVEYVYPVNFYKSPKKRPWRIPEKNDM